MTPPPKPSDPSTAKAKKKKKAKKRKLEPVAQPSTLLPQAHEAARRGEWAMLSALADQSGADHPDHAALLVLGGLARAQRGDAAGAANRLQEAMAQGASRRDVAQAVVGGAFDSLGRAAALFGDSGLAESFFAEALAQDPPPGDITEALRDRMIRARADMGLLPEAVASLGDGLAALEAMPHPSEAQLAMFKSQLELLNHTLGLAQQRALLPFDSATKPARPLALEQRAMSQLGQDLWVLQRTGMKQGGYFVEFGASDGRLLSNTCLLETEFGWKGICAEPNPAFYDRLRVNRTCTTVPDCVMGETGKTVEFILASEYGTVAGFDDSDTHAERRRAFRAQGQVISVPTISLHDMLVKYGAPRQIDYISIDTEGTEYEILAAFPFDQWDVQLLTVEHNFTPLREKIHDLLRGHGYHRTEMKWDDWYEKRG